MVALSNIQIFILYAKGEQRKEHNIFHVDEVFSFIILCK